MSSKLEEREIQLGLMNDTSGILTPVTNSSWVIQIPRYTCSSVPTYSVVLVIKFNTGRIIRAGVVKRKRPG